MKIITEKQFNDFASKFFPSKAIHYDETYAFIQAGSCLGKNLHYECDETSVNLHIEGSEWRHIRDYLNANLNKERLTPSHWGRQNCQWTIDNEIHTAADVMQAFLDIRGIIEPVIEQFEGKEPQDYSGIILLQHDWNDTSDADVVNLDTKIPIGKKGYGVEKIIVEIEPQKETTKEDVKVLDEKYEADVKKKIEVNGINKTVEKENKTALAKQETNQRMKITPIDLPPVTIERKIDQLGITLTKTYDKFAEAPIQGVDAAGRRTKNIQMLTQFPKLDSLKKVQLTNYIPISGNKNEVAKKLFNSIQNTGRPSYDKSFWEHLAQNCDLSTFAVETGYELMSTFGVVSIIPTIEHSISAADEKNESVMPTFSFDSKYFDSLIEPEDIVAVFSEENTVEITDDEITFSSPKFNNLHTVIGSYKTPKGFNNVCPECDGEKKIRCSRCGGSGREQYEEGEYADGRPKIKTGQCSRCYGRGFFVCKACNETGKIDQGTGMIQIMETVATKLKLREKVVISNSFFNFNSNIGNDIQGIKKHTDESSDRKKRKKELYKEMKKACRRFVENWEEMTYKYDDLDFTSYCNSDFNDIEDAKGLVSDWKETKYWFRSPDGLSDVEYCINEIEELSRLKVSKEDKLNSLYSNLFLAKYVEVIFKNQQEIAFDNMHRWSPTNIPADELELLYQQNLQKANDVFKLDSQNERILSILEKHTIEDNLLKITIPLESNQSFDVYYSEKNNSLYCSKNLPKIASARKQFEAEEQIEHQRLEKQRKREEKAREERARKAEEQRQAHFSQSMDTLLDKEPTKKIGVFSKLFKTDSFKKTSDAEKTIKLMIYMAKADGTLDIDEKESLTSAILNTFSDAYTAENRQRFIAMLDSDSLPELTKEDVTFSTTNGLKKALKKMEEMAAIGGIAPKEKELLVRVRELAGISK